MVVLPNIFVVFLPLFYFYLVGAKIELFNTSMSQKIATFEITKAETNEVEYTHSNR